MKKLFVLCVAILMAFPSFLKAFENSVWVDVSHSQGVPLGGLGNGYVMYGKYGFIRANLDNWPDKYSYGFETPESIWGYHKRPDAKFNVPWGFVVKEGKENWNLISDGSSDGFEKMSAYAYLPKAKFNLSDEKKGLEINIEAFTPLVPHDLVISSTPVQIYDITLKNQKTRLEELIFVSLTLH